MIATPDFTVVYDEIESLHVEIRFDVELGFPYLQDKLSEVVQRSGQAATLMVKLMRASDRIQQERIDQRALYNQTGVAAHREAERHAQDIYDRLQRCVATLKVRRERLRAIPQDLRTHMRLLEDELALERLNLAGSTKRQPAINAARTFDEVPLGRRVSTAPTEEELEKLFG